MSLKPAQRAAQSAEQPTEQAVAYLREVGSDIDKIIGQARAYEAKKLTEPNVQGIEPLEDLQTRIRQGIMSAEGGDLGPAVGHLAEMVALYNIAIRQEEEEAQEILNQQSGMALPEARQRIETSLTEISAVPDLRTAVEGAIYQTPLGQKLGRVDRLREEHERVRQIYNEALGTLPESQRQHLAETVIPQKQQLAEEEFDSVHWLLGRTN